MARLAVALIAVLLWADDQDRTDLRLPIDTWYKVVQGTRPVGYVHETLKRAAPPWRYEYALDGEFELTLRGKPHAEDVVASALLDDTLSPVEFSSEGHVNERFSSVSMVTLAEERRVELRTDSTGEPLAWVQPAHDDLLVLPALALYQLRQNETLSRPGRITRRTLDPRGQNKEGIEVLLEAGDAVKRPYLGKEATVVPVTFLKPFPATARETELREVFVDRYGRILEASLAGGARMIIVAHRTDAMEGIGLLHRHGRRDPFDRAAAMRNSALERARAARGELEVPKPVVTLDSLDSDLTGAMKLIEEARAQKSTGDLEEARQNYLKAVVHLKAIRELALLRRPDLLPQIERTRDDAEAAWNGAALVEREAGLLFSSVPGLSDRLDVDRLERLQKELQQLRDRVEVERRPERERISSWTTDVGMVLAKCRTRLELARAPLSVTGITMGEKSTQETVDAKVSLFGQVLGPLEPVTVVRPFAMANVNGRLVTRGDLIEGTQIRVDAITARSVQFSLREEVRDVGLSR